MLKASLIKITVSKLLEKLVSLKLVNRIEHQTDNRAKNVSLTLADKKLVKQLIPLVEKVDARFFEKNFKTRATNLAVDFSKVNIWVIDCEKRITFVPAE